MSTKKQSINPLKKQIKTGQKLIYITAADYLYSIATHMSEFLSYKNLQAYFTDDPITNYTSYLNLQLPNYNYPINDDFRNILNILCDVAIHNISDFNSTIIDKLHLACTSFIKKYSIKEYHCFCRSLCNIPTLPNILIPIYLILDFSYNPLDICLGYSFNFEIMCSHNPFIIHNINIPIPLAFFTSIDNIDLSCTSLQYTQHPVLKLANNYIDQLAHNKLYNLITLSSTHPILLAISKIMYFNSLFNKYNIYPTNDPTQLLSPNNYAIIAQIDKSISNFKCILQTFLFELDTMILTHRKFLFNDCCFNKSFNLTKMFHLQDPTICNYLINNIRIKEFQLPTLDNTQHIINIAYDFNYQTRTIPLLINNISAFIHAYNFLDLLVVFYILFQYEVLNEVQIKNQDPAFYAALYAFNIFDFDNTSSKRYKKTSKPYKQSKETFIKAYVRKLPKGQVASETAVNLAKQHLIDLGDDYTMVSSFIRNKK